MDLSYSRVKKTRASGFMFPPARALFLFSLALLPQFLLLLQRELLLFLP